MRIRCLAPMAVLALLPAAIAVAQVEPRRTGTGGIQGFKVARASYDKARKLFEKREINESRQQLDICLQRMPDFSDAHFLLAKIEYVEKRFPEALAHMERAEVTYVAFSAMYVDLQADRVRELERMRDNKDLRIADLRDVLTRTTNPETRAAIEMQIAQAQHDREEINRQLYEPIDVASGVPAAYHFFHGNILLRLNRLDDASAQYREALRVEPTHADASNNLASLYLSAGHPQVASDILDLAESKGVTVNAELKKAVQAALQK